MVAEIISVTLYFIPQTSVLGAILLTGFFGGAVAVHARAGDGLFYIPVLFGIVIWLGIYFREPRLRTIALYRKC